MLKDDDPDGVEIIWDSESDSSDGDEDGADAGGVAASSTPAASASMPGPASFSVLPSVVRLTASTGSSATATSKLTKQEYRARFVDWSCQCSLQCGAKLSERNKLEDCNFQIKFLERNLDRIER